MSFQTICFATDFSPASQAAFDAAVDVTRGHGGELELLHVLPAPGYVLPDGSFVPASAKELLAASEAVDRELEVWRQRAVAAGVRARVTSIMGHPVTEILRHATDAPCDLLVLGTHGRGFFRHALLGSVAERVVRGAPCPVMTVRTGGA